MYLIWQKQEGQQKDQQFCRLKSFWVELNSEQLWVSAHVFSPSSCYITNSTFRTLPLFHDHFLSFVVRALQYLSAVLNLSICGLIWILITRWDCNQSHDSQYELCLYCPAHVFWGFQMYKPKQNSLLFHHNFFIPKYAHIWCESLLICSTHLT